jgi:hypothetical protein
VLSSLIFTRYSTVPIAHIAPVVVAAAFVAALASIAAIFPSRLGSDRSKARSLVN